MAQSQKNPNKQRTILVTGATGQQGGATARHLRRRGFPVRALTRHPENPEARVLTDNGIEVVQGDYDDPRSLTRALDGVYGVFSVQQHRDSGIEGEIRQGKALADAAQRSQISHFVYASVVGADRTTGIPFFDSKYELENHLRALGMAYTILRPAFFMENWLGAAETLRSGTLGLPLTPDGRFQQIAVDDIGGIAATAFEHPGHWQGRSIEIAGDEPSMSALAAVFSRVLGREVRYAQMPWEDFEKHQGTDYTKMFRWFQDGGSHADIAALRSEYSPLTRFEKWAIQQNWAGAGGATARAR